jgi:hypothetical protein
MPKVSVKRVKIDAAKASAPNVRDANFELRNSSKYWYDKYKDAA